MAPPSIDIKWLKKEVGIGEIGTQNDIFSILGSKPYYFTTKNDILKFTLDTWFSLFAM